VNKISDFVFRIAARAYLRLVNGSTGQRLNNVVFQLALKGRGFNNCCDMSATGEAWFLNRLAKTRPALCVDIGANIGQYSKAILESTGAVVFSFEPLPDAFSELHQLKNQFPERIHTFPLALGNTKGFSTLYFGDSKSELASLSEEVNQIEYVGASNTSKMEVSIDKLDSYLEDLQKVAKEIDFLKIDVEGYEWEVLDGAQRVLSEMKPKFVQLEFNYHQLFRGHTLLSLAAMLPGYRAFQLLPKGAGMVERNPKDPLANIYSYTNFVFIRPGVEIR
jgi:FkbM family methyltransferase